jgi:hypothetical protein
MTQSFGSLLIPLDQIIHYLIDRKWCGGNGRRKGIGICACSHDEKEAEKDSERFRFGLNESTKVESYRRCVRTECGKHESSVEDCG